MKKALKLLKVSFDNIENLLSNSIIKEEIGIFIENEELSAQGKISQFFKNLPPFKFYVGHDGEVYPKFIIEEINVN